MQMNKCIQATKMIRCHVFNFLVVIILTILFSLNSIFHCFCLFRYQFEMEIETKTEKEHESWCMFVLLCKKIVLFCL